MGRHGHDVEENGVRTLDDGRELELGAFVTGHADTPLGLINWGGRLANIRSDARNADEFNSTLVLGHLGYFRSIRNRLFLRASAHRIGNQPTLSQLFFTGTTGRGSIIGNPELDAERGWSYEIGAAMNLADLKLDVAAFRSDFDSFIEKIALTESVDTFINDQGGRVQGISARLEWSFRRLNLNAGFNHIRGELDDGEPMRDIPEAAVSLSGSLTLSGGQLSMVVDHRFDSDRVASTNLAVEHRTLVSASYRHAISQRAHVELFGKNLLNEEYRETNDAKSALGTERTMGVAINLLL